MKILLITCDYMPDSKKVSAKMFHELSTALTRLGHQVTCITPLQDSSCQLLELDGVTIYRFKSGAVKNVNFVKRLINECLFSIRAWRLIKQNPCISPDYVIWTSPSIFWGSCIQKIKRTFNVKAYLVLRDFFPRWAIDQNMIRERSLTARFLKYHEKKNYEAASMIGVMSPQNLLTFNSMTSDRYLDKTDVLYNWVDTSFIDKVKRNSSFRDEYQLHGKVLFIYGGNMGLAQDMPNIIRLANRMKGISHAAFVLIGQGDQYSLVEHRIKELHLTNVVLLPALKQEDYFSIQKACDVGLFTLHRSHTTHNFPGKLLGYMAQGLPVLGSINNGNDLYDMLNNNNAGLVSINGDDDCFFNHCMKFCNDSVLRSIYGRNSYDLIDRYFSVATAARKVINHQLTKAH